MLPPFFSTSLGRFTLLVVACLDGGRVARHGDRRSEWHSRQDDVQPRKWGGRFARLGLHLLADPARVYLRKSGGEA